MSATAPKPPPREPHYFDEEIYGWPRRQCAINLVTDLANWCTPPLEFKDSANGRIWHFIGDKEIQYESAQLLFDTDKGAGRIELFITDDFWVCAELFMGDEMKLRAWLEAPYEEKAFWPDDADGIDEAPGRISKHGAWLQIYCPRFPGVSSETDEYWDVIDLKANT